jgi:hypothetical protein
VRQPELEPGKGLINAQVEQNKGTVGKKISELVDEVRLILSSKSAFGCSHYLIKLLLCSPCMAVFNFRQK